MVAVQCSGNGLVMADDDFEPRLGRQRAQGGKRARQYLGRVLAAANLARGGARLFGTSSSGFNGSRIGRGASTVCRSP